MSRESALGAWADKIPQVDGNPTGQSWTASGAEQAPMSREDMAHEIKGIGILLLIGIGLLLGGGIFSMWSLSVVLGSEESTGVVVDYQRRMSKGGDVYAPIVAYYADGYEYEHVSSLATSWTSYEIGDEVSMLYSPDDPESASINSFTNMWLLPTLLCGAGLVFTLGAAGLGVYITKKSGWRLLPG